MRREIDCGQRTAHPEHVWKNLVIPPEGARVGVAHTETWWCAGVSPSLPPWYGQVDCATEDRLLAQRGTLVARGDAQPTYLTGVAAETIQAGARWWLDTATGTLHAHRPQPPSSGDSSEDRQESRG